MYPNCIRYTDISLYIQINANSVYCIAILKKIVHCLSEIQRSLELPAILFAKSDNPQGKEHAFSCPGLNAILSSKSFIWNTKKRENQVSENLSHDSCERNVEYLLPISQVGRIREVNFSSRTSVGNQKMSSSLTNVYLIMKPWNVIGLFCHKA